MRFFIYKVTASNFLKMLLPLHFLCFPSLESEKLYKEKWANLGCCTQVLLFPFKKHNVWKVSLFSACDAVVPRVLSLLWYPSVFCHLQSCYCWWAWTAGTALCGFAAGQLSWTISVVTGPQTQVVLSVYHEDLVVWLISSIPGALSCVKHCTLAFFPRQVPAAAPGSGRSLRPCKFPGYPSPFLFVWLALGHSRYGSGPTSVSSSDKNGRRCLPAVGLCVCICKSRVFAAAWGDWSQ